MSITKLVRSCHRIPHRGVAPSLLPRRRRVPGRSGWSEPYPGEARDHPALRTGMRVHQATGVAVYAVLMCVHLVVSYLTFLCRISSENNDEFHTGCEFLRFNLSEVTPIESFLVAMETEVLSS